MVADALDVASDLEVGADCGGVLLVGLVHDDVGDVLGDLLVEIVDILLGGLRALHALYIPLQHCLEAGGDVLLRHAHHAVELLADLGDIHRGKADGVLLLGGRHRHQKSQVHPLLLVFLAVGQDAHGDLHQISAEGQQQQGGHNIKEGVHVGNLRRRVVGGHGLHKPGQRRGHADDGEQNGAEHVEHQVDDGGALGVAAGADGGQNGGDTGADVLSEEDVYRAVQADYPTKGQRLQDTHRGGGGLDQSGEGRSRQNADNGVGEGAHQIDKGGPFPQGLHGRAHHLHTDKEHAQAGQNISVVVNLGLLQKDHHGHAHKGEQGSHGAHVQGDELAGDGGADIGAHDDPHRLFQRHHAGVDEAHHHDSGGGGGLDDRGNARAHQDAQEAVGGQPLQNALHAVARRGLQAGAHHLHAVKEQGQAAQQPQENAYV